MVTPDDTQLALGDLLSDISSHAGHLRIHQERMRVILTHFAEQQLPLAICADRRHLNRKPATLKEYARRFGLAFPDYVPRAMRWEPENKQAP